MYIYIKNMGYMHTMYVLYKHYTGIINQKLQLLKYTSPLLL